MRHKDTSGVTSGSRSQKSRRSVTTTKSSASLSKNRKDRVGLSKALCCSGRKLRLGKDVLARWTDGLLYLGTITKVQPMRCCVTFEDSSLHWILNKDIKRGASPEEIRCISCRGGTSDSPNEIVICDHCGSGYHQRCHKPQIKVEVLKSDVKWFCRQCLVTTTAKKGGALKNGVKARAVQVIKQALPYDLRKLTWDCHHKTNREQCYCYCSGPGDWYMKMLQCCRCLQWFHEACIQCLNEPLVCGDQMYVFACSACNSGPEYIKRLQMTWADLIHLALFNLTMDSHQKYSDFDSVLMPWIRQKWDNLKIIGFEDKTSTWLDCSWRVMHVLNKYKSRFQNGRECKKSSKLWGLRCRLPPPGPTIVLPSTQRLTDDIVDQAQIVEMPEPTALHSMWVPRKPGCRRPARRVDTQAAVEPPTSPVRCLSSNQQYAGYTGDQAAYHAPYRPPPVRQNSRLRRDLSVLIPAPNSYAGTEHPFMTALERQTIIETNAERRRLLQRYTADKNNNTENIVQPRRVMLLDSVYVKRGRKSKADKKAARKCLASDRIKRDRHPFDVLGRRVSADGEVQYLLNWTM